MPARRLKEFLEQREIPYKSILHPQTFTAQRTAEITHVQGRMMAKTVIVRVDGFLSMVVLPATCRVDVAHIKEAIGAEHVELADESEFATRFPDCEVGAMPPFGNLYGMGVFVHEDLTKDKEIAFNAGTHNEIVLLSYRDFESIVKPATGAYAL